MWLPCVYLLTYGTLRHVVCACVYRRDCVWMSTRLCVRVDTLYSAVVLLVPINFRFVLGYSSVWFVTQRQDRVSVGRPIKNKQHLVTACRWKTNRIHRGSSPRQCFFFSFFFVRITSVGVAMLLFSLLMINRHSHCHRPAQEHQPEANVELLLRDVVLQTVLASFFCSGATQTD